MRTTALLLLVASFAGACTDPGPKVGETDPPDSAGDDTGVPTVEGALDLGGFTPTNVVLIHVDTLRADSLPRWGSARDTMPFLGARAGWISVDRVVGTASWTAPATGSLLSGTDPMTHGIRYYEDGGEGAPLAAPSYATALQGQGFATAVFTGSHVFTNPEFELEQGFDVSIRVDAEPANGSGVGEAAIRWLDTLEPETPFFLFLQPMDLHAPYHPEEQDYGTWSVDADVPFVLFDPGEAQEAQIDAALADATTDEERARVLTATRAVYDEQMLGLDRAMSVLMDDLSARGLLEETLIVITADHGESFYDGPPAHLGHGAVLRHEIIHLPLLFWGAGLTDAHVSCLASNMDVLPTVVDAMNLSPLPSAEGSSLLEGCRDVAFSAVYEAIDGVEKLTSVSAESAEAQVLVDCVTGTIAYDLTADPGATDPLEAGAVPGGPALVEALGGYVEQIAAALPGLTCEAL